MHDYPDYINSAFEFGAAIILWLHVKTILKEKEVKGVSYVPFLFYTLWGFWNLFYYKHLVQEWSFYAGIFVAAVNAYYSYLLVYYRVFYPRKKTSELPTPN